MSTVEMQVNLKDVTVKRSDGSEMEFEKVDRVIFAEGCTFIYAGDAGSFRKMLRDVEEITVKS